MQAVGFGIFLVSFVHLLEQRHGLRAQRRQFAEADPSMDVDGWDGAAKICALANVLLNANATPEDVRVRSLREITPREIKAARETNCRIKYICSAERAEDGALALCASYPVKPGNRHSAHESVINSAALRPHNGP